MNNPAPLFIKASIGPLSVEFLCHPDSDSFDKQAGYKGAALEDAHRYHVHRSTVNEFDPIFTKWLEEFTGIKREIDEKKTNLVLKKHPGSNRIVYETFPTYLRRIENLVSPDQLSAIREAALVQSRLLAVNVAPAQPSSPIEPRFYRAADSLLSQDLETIKKHTSFYLSRVPNFDLISGHDDRPDRESLAKLIRMDYQIQLLSED